MWKQHIHPNKTRNPKHQMSRLRNATTEIQSMCGLLKSDCSCLWKKRYYINVTNLWLTHCILRRWARVLFPKKGWLGCHFLNFQNQFSKRQFSVMLHPLWSGGAKTSHRTVIVWTNCFWLRSPIGTSRVVRLYILKWMIIQSKWQTVSITWSIPHKAQQIDA